VTAAASDILSLGCHVFVLLRVAPGAWHGIFPWHGFWGISLFFKQASLFAQSTNKDIILMNNVQGQAARKTHKA